VQRLITTYKLWHELLPHVPKDSRYTLGIKIDALLVETFEAVFTASYLPREEKLPFVRTAIAKIDLAKFFLRVTWEIRALDEKKYIALSELFDEIGRQLGGWMRQITAKTTSAPNK